MDPQKRKLIIGEIEKWRQSRLLPEHYCDFLLNLYLEDGNGRKSSVLGLSPSNIKNSRGWIWLLIFGSVGLFSFIAFHFSAFAMPMQIAAAGLVTLLLYIAGARQRIKNPVLSYLLLGAGSLVLLAAGLYFLDRWEASPSAVMLYAAACAIIWMLLGILAHMGIFHFAGWAVLALLYGRFLLQNIPDLDWLGLQMSWLPAGIVLGWVGWLFHHRNKRIGAVLLTVGLLIWFVPELFGMAVTELPGPQLQLSLFGKLAVSGAALFALRKKWTEWVV